MGKIRKMFQNVCCWNFYPACRVSKTGIKTKHEMMQKLIFFLTKHKMMQKLIFIHPCTAHISILCMVGYTWLSESGTHIYDSLDYFSRRQIGDIFPIFPGKQDMTFHANCLQWRQFAWKCHILFSGKNEENISKCRLLKFLPRVLC